MLDALIFKHDVTVVDDKPFHVHAR